MTDLERALLELDVDWPATPDLAASVTARLAAEPAPSAAGRRRPSAGGRRRGLAARAALALVLLGGGALAVSPDARSSVLRFLGLQGVEVRREPPRATPLPTSPLGETLGLGTPVTLAQARRAAPVLAPASLGAPGAVYLRTGSVALVYAPRAGLPASRITGVALLVQTFRATMGPMIQKTAAMATRFDRLTIDGAHAYWIEGGNGFAYASPRSGGGFEPQRIADRTLLVERDGLLLRIEGRLTRAHAVALAREALS